MSRNIAGRCRKMLILRQLIRCGGFRSTQWLLPRCKPIRRFRYIGSGRPRLRRATISRPPPQYIRPTLDRMCRQGLLRKTMRLRVRIPGQLNTTHYKRYLYGVTPQGRRWFAYHQENNGWQDILPECIKRRLAPTKRKPWHPPAKTPLSKTDPDTDRTRREIPVPDPSNTPASVCGAGDSTTCYR